jgi:hypothetical protein
MGETFNRRSTLCVSLGSKRDGRTHVSELLREHIDNAPYSRLHARGFNLPNVPQASDTRPIFGLAPLDRKDVPCSWCVLPELNGLVKRFSVRGRTSHTSRVPRGPASPLQTGSAGSPTCRATARIPGLALGEMAGFPDREDNLPDSPI